MPARHILALNIILALFLILAFLDGALHDYKAPDGLWEDTVPEGSDHVVLVWNDKMQERQICRKIRPYGFVENEAYTQSQFLDDFKKLLAAEGYVNPGGSVHRIRRFEMGQINSESYLSGPPLLG